MVTAAAALLPTSALAGLSARVHPVDPQWLAFTATTCRPRDWASPWPRVTAVLAAPLAEELLFRGLIYRLARRTWGAWPAAVVSSLVFGLIHGEPWYLFGLVGLGLILAYLYEATGSLLAPVIAHALHNAVSLYVMLRPAGPAGGETSCSRPPTGRCSPSRSRRSPSPPGCSRAARAGSARIDQPPAQTRP